MKSLLQGSLSQHFPIPKILAMPSVGVEVVPESIRFLELIDKGGSFSVGKFGEERLATTGEEENFPNIPPIKEALVALKKKHKLDLVSAALPEEKAYIFNTEMPQLSPDEIRVGLELKLEEHVPIPPRDAVFDYQVISTDVSSERLRVSVAVVPNLVVSRYVDLFVSAGLVPVFFELSAQASANALLKRGDQSVAIIATIGDRDTRFALVSNRTVHFTSVLNVGGFSLTEAIKKHFSVSDSEAEKMKMEQGIVRGSKKTDLLYSVTNVLSVLKDEIEKLGAYWDSHVERYSNTKEKLSKVILCGKEASLPGFPEYLETSIKLPVTIGNVWENVFSFDSYLPPLSHKDSLSYSVAVGLSIRT